MIVMLGLCSAAVSSGMSLIGGCPGAEYLTGRLGMHNMSFTSRSIWLGRGWAVSRSIPT